MGGAVTAPVETADGIINAHRSFESLFKIQET